MVDERDGRQAERGRHVCRWVRRRPAPQRGSASSERWLRWLQMALHVLVNAPRCRYKAFLLAMLAKLGQVKQSARMLYAHEIGASDDTRLVVIFSRQ